jgi:hypothetical protein
VIGFAKLMGDLIDGLIAGDDVLRLAVVIASLVIIYGYTRCVRSTALVVAARWWRWSGSWAGGLRWASSSTRIRSWCRSWCSPSA